MLIKSLSLFPAPERGQGTSGPSRFEEHHPDRRMGLELEPRLEIPHEDLPVSVPQFAEVPYSLFSLGGRGSPRVLEHSVAAHPGLGGASHLGLEISGGPAPPSLLPLREATARANVLTQSPVRRSWVRGGLSPPETPTPDHI